MKTLDSALPKMPIFKKHFVLPHYKIINGNKKTICSDENTLGYSYIPNDYPNIFTKLGQINNDENLLKFINIYGSPLESLTTRIIYDDLIQELHAYKKILNLYFEYALENGSLESLFHELKMECRLKLVWQEDEDEVKPEIYPDVKLDSLFDYAKLQIFFAVINKTNFRKCRCCGKLFPITTKGMEYCQPLPHRKRSSCEMHVNNLLKKAWKLRREHVSMMDEIYHVIDLPQSEIDNYIVQREK